MTRLIAAIALFNTLLTPSFGQADFSVKATYLSILNLSSNPESLDRQNCELLIQGPRSLFYYLPPPTGQREDTKVGTDDFGTPTVELRLISKDSINKRYYIDRQKQQLISREFVFAKGKGTPYIVLEDLRHIPWVLVDEFKDIGRFRCQKATGRFRGRIYTAWFTSQIPVNAGPWKLHGLPGLILEAYDRNRVAHFRCQSVEFPYQGALQITPPTDGHPVSLSAYIEAREKTATNFKNYLLSKLPRGATIEVNSVRSYDLEQEFDFGKQ